MTTTQGTDGWKAAVRQRVGLGTLLPLGGPPDGAWLAERAAAGEMERAARAVAGVAPGPLRVSATGTGAPGTLGVPLPPGALPPGPLRVDCGFEATTGEVLPVLAERLREALFASADGLGLSVAEVHLTVTGLLDTVGETRAASTPVGLPDVSVQDAAGRAVTAVPGVAQLTEILGNPVIRTPGHIRVECAIAAGHHPLTVARAVRSAVAAAEPGMSVTVLVTAVEVAVPR